MPINNVKRVDEPENHNNQSKKYSKYLINVYKLISHYYFRFRFHKKPRNHHYAGHSHSFRSIGDIKHHHLFHFINKVLQGEEINRFRFYEWKQFQHG